VSDREIINNILKGESHLFELLVDRYKSMVFKVAMGFVHDTQAANDIVQDVFVKLWSQLGDFTFEAKLSTWLYRVTVNTSLNVLRKDKFKSMIEDISHLTRTNDDGSIEIQIEDSYGETPEDYVRNEELRQLLKKAIDSLPKKQKIAFVLSKYRGLSSKDIAEIMEISPGNVDVLIYRAKQKLQKYILKHSKNFNPNDL